MKKILLLLALSLAIASGFFVLSGQGTGSTVDLNGAGPGNEPACDKAAAGFCEKDGDCICGGIDRTTGECFIGNLKYYGSCVDKTKDCPDFCSGITGKMRLRCEKNSCVQYMP
jgi:hypothetical protein